jgi:hypothetical protein
VIYPLNMGNYIWLVVYLPLWKIMEWKSVGIFFTHSRDDEKVTLNGS